jgi:hypothetical protein
MAEVDAVTKSRQDFAEVLRKHRIKGMGRADMLDRWEQLGPSGFGATLGASPEIDPELDDIDSKKYLDPDKFKTFVDKMYSGKMDTARDRQQRRQIERSDFARQQKSRKLDREAAFTDKMDRQRKESAAKFGVKHEVETPGLDRIAAMQDAPFGTSTAHAGEIAKGVGQQSRRTVTPRSAAFGAEARAHERAGNKAEAAKARAAQFAERRGEPNIRGQVEKQRERERERDAREKHLKDKAAREADAAAAKARAEAEKNR